MGIRSILKGRSLHGDIIGKDKKDQSSSAEIGKCGV